MTPAILAAGWDTHTQIAEQRAVTDGRVIPGTVPRRAKPKRLDYLLRYTRDLPLAVVEAKAYDAAAASGMQQAIDYALKLGVPYAYATNGREIFEHDLLNGVESTVDRFPSPDELWHRYKVATELPSLSEKLLLTPFYPDGARAPRHYQYTSVNRTVSELGRGRDRILLTLATGTGKSFIAFQTCWRVWNAGWNRSGEARKPRILYLADRNVLLDQPRLGVFAPFGDAIHQMGADPVMSREMYFASYQQLAVNERGPALYSKFPRDFFDLVIVDECHRGSAGDDSMWRAVLDHFEGAAKVGMTATPSRELGRDTYDYFGASLAEYTLAEGIDDGFLAPYKVRRIVTDVDALGYRPASGETDRYGQLIPDRIYGTPNFDADLVLTRRVEAHARNLTDYLRATDPMAKTVVFCRDQEHALNMRNAIARLNPEMVRADPNYVVRISSDEGELGRTRLGEFQDVETTSPVVVTSSDMLTTGVDAPMVKNVVIARWVTSMSMFKQMIGRGTRLRTDEGKWYFTIHDLTGAATVLFADEAFDGYPEAALDQEIDDPPVEPGLDDLERPLVEERPGGYDRLLDDEARRGRSRFYVDGEPVEIVAETVYHLAGDGSRISEETYVQFACTEVRKLAPDHLALAAIWGRPRERHEFIDELEGRGVDVKALGRRDSEIDDFDVLASATFRSEPRSRADRAARVRALPGFLEQYGPGSAVLNGLLDRYEEFGVDEIDLPGALLLPPVAEMGTVTELMRMFGGPGNLREAVEALQWALYDNVRESTW